MNRELDRLSRLLAASGFSEREIGRMLRAAAAAPDAVMARMSAYRKDAHAPSDMDQASERHRRRTTDRDLTEQLCHILLVEAHLTPKKAVEYILGEIGPHTVDVDIPKFDRVSFRRWLSVLLRRIPASALLHVAYSIRNRVAHRPGDWPLRDDK